MKTGYFIYDVNRNLTHNTILDMKIIFHLTLFALILLLPSPSSSTRYETLTRGSSLAPQRGSLISSPSGVFTAGFYPVGENAYIFSIWYTEPLFDGSLTLVWMANRDRPVNGRYTKLSLLNSGELVLNDAGQYVVWTSDTESSLPVLLKLRDDGNLVLHTEDGVNIWESFDSPTNTLLPLQSLQRNTKLVSSRSRADCSSGLYKFLFANNCVLSLLYDSGDFTSIYWPPPWLTIWEEGRTSYNASKIATLDLRGSFHSSDKFQINTSDYGFGPQRRMTLDHDGNLRVYSLDKGLGIWNITWQAFRQPCKVHGLCGVNSVCSYRHDSSRCSCLPGHKMKNPSDWSKGCVPEFELPCSVSYSPYFLKHNHYQFYGYDKGFFPNCTLDQCKKLCSSDCDCIGFQYDQETTGSYTCYTKPTLLNGLQTPGVWSWFYLKLPQSWGSSGRNSTADHIDMKCPSSVTQLNIQYRKKGEDGWFKYLLWCTVATGAFEIFCLLIYLYKTRKSSSPTGEGYVQAGTGLFKRYTYAELKKASNNFSQEIGRGGSGVVYKGTLPDNRIAAIKFLSTEAKQGEAEFLAEVNLIGRLNHANLIEPWGYCAEGKYRLLVFEYLEQGSLAENLYSDKLDWKKRYDIAIGAAKGLAYLHEECLEWVLHCDVKPHNILLDSNYEPKVADFGLAKLLNRSSEENMNVSRIRGTRGYMAPEWVSCLPITSKVDVYSYGIVVLEMVTGENPKELYDETKNRGMKGKMAMNWVMEIMNEEGWIEKIVGPRFGGEYDAGRLGKLVEVALKCVQENRDDRPTMREVVSMLVY